MPTYSSAPNSDSWSTEPVSTSTYQPRMSVSISKAQEVSRSEGHWIRKLRTRNGARTEGPYRSVKPRHGSPSSSRPPFAARHVFFVAATLAKRLSSANVAADRAGVWSETGSGRTRGADATSDLRDAGIVSPPRARLGRHRNTSDPLRQKGTRRVTQATLFIEFYDPDNLSPDVRPSLPAAPSRRAGGSACQWLR